MSDDLKKLRADMAAMQPTPDADRKAANLALAQKNFDRLQGSATEARPTSDRRSALGRLLSGVSNMFQSLSTRGALAATTAIVAVGLVIVVPQTRDIFAPPGVISLGKPTLEATQVEVPDTEVTARLRDEAPSDATQSLPIVEQNSGDNILAEESAEGRADLSLSRAQKNETDAIGGLTAPAQLLAETAPAPAFELGIVDDFGYAAPADTETFANEAPSSLKITAEEPVSTFSIDVDTASYAVVRSSLMAGFLPPPDAVRIEEMINYFPYDYTVPDADGAPFSQAVSVFETPWNAETRLVHIALQGQMPALETRPPLNLVFLIDTSGSMQDANKLPLLIQSFKLMLGQLRPADQVAIVAYAGSAGQVLEPTPASDRATILAALDNLHAGGSTAGQAGLQQAYSVAEGMADDGEVTRVILATDGDFNVGLSGTEELKDFIAEKRDSGTYLSVLGFGRGNLDDATMQALAQNGNGTAAYIDTLNEAQKVLVDQLTGALFTIAGDVKIQVEFNPAIIAEYRLIGYETRALAREDFNNDAVDAGDIGAGHSVTALYEVTPVGSPAVLNDPLRYQRSAPQTDETNELGFLRLRYKEPGEAESKLIEMPIANNRETIGVDARFAASIAGFGQLLRGSDYLGSWSWGDAIALASGAVGEDAFGYRREAVSLMRLAQSLSEQ